MIHIQNQNLDSRSQGELLMLVRKLAFCEPFELQGLKIAAREFIDDFQFRQMKTPFSLAIQKTGK